jgi:hypothetical protein
MMEQEHANRARGAVQKNKKQKIAPDTNARKSENVAAV